MWVMSVLGIKTALARSGDLGVPILDKEVRPLEFLSRIGASSYLIGPSALPYTNVELFRRRNISLDVKAYAYEKYPQRGQAFMENLSVIDLIFNTGYAARDYLKSTRRNTTIT